MATNSPADFEDSRFDYGERVRVLLRHPTHGFVMGEAEGVCYGRETDIDVSRDGEEPRYRTLVWVKEMEGYTKPSDVPGADPEPVREAWFDEAALRKRDVPDPLEGVSWN